MLWTAIIPAAFGLVGVALGGYISAYNQKRERERRRRSDQLGEFYGPMLALRADVLAKSELRVKISGAASAAWWALMEDAGKGGVEHRREVREQRFPLFEKIIEYNNRELAEDILPTYRKMVELFRSKMHFAEFSTIEHFATLLEFVEIWNRWLDKSLPSEVLEQLNHSENKLYPFYEDLADTFVCMQQRLGEKRRWWRCAPAVKVLPSQ
jgi:hypothetical protein